MRVYNRETIEARNKGKIYNGVIFTREAQFYRNPTPVYKLQVPIQASGSYTNSGVRKRYVENEIMPMVKRLIQGKEYNAQTGFDATLLAHLGALTLIDIQRLASEMADYVDTMYNVTDRPDAEKEVKLRLILPSTVVPGETTGTGDLVPLMQEPDHLVEEVKMKIIGFGCKSMLNEILWSPGYDQIAESAARAIVDYRNSLVFNDMVAASYDANHSVPFATGTGAESYHELLYMTIENARIKALNLKNPLTGKLLAVTPSLETTLYVSVQDEMTVKKVVEGQLTGAGGVRIAAGALPINNLVAYSGGNQHGENYQGKIVSYPGVEPGYGYLHMKARDGAQLIRKIDWQPEFNAGETKIEGQTRYWWTVLGTYNSNILPSTVGSDYYGAIIKFPLH